MLYTAAVWWSIVFLGDHYVVDVLGGIAYAWAAYLVAPRLSGWFGWLTSRVRGPAVARGRHQTTSRRLSLRPDAGGTEATPIANARIRPPTAEMPPGDSSARRSDHSLSPVSPGRRQAEPPGTEPGLGVRRGAAQHRSIHAQGGRSMRRPWLSVVAAMAALFTLAAPALACGGLIGPNGAVNLLRTTTFAGYHDGIEHYVTAFEFAGGEGSFGSIIPLPDVPTSVERGGDWTLQRLVARPIRLPRRSSAATPAAGAAEAKAARDDDRRPRDHDPARRRRRGRAVGQEPRLPPAARRARGARLLRRALAIFMAASSTPMRPASVARRSATAPRST